MSHYRIELLAAAALLSVYGVLALASRSWQNALRPERPAMSSTPVTDPSPGAPLARTGDEIVACGQFFHTGTPVVLWLDPGGYDAYRVETRFTRFENSDWETASKLSRELRSPNRYGLRRDVLTPAELERVRGGGWDLDLLRRSVDQFVLHYDAAGTSKRCFAVLHDQRCLSVHFMLDLDGTIYQTLDLKERAWHATSSNSRSVGIEIANIGAFEDLDIPLVKRWYYRDDTGKLRLSAPEGENGIRDKDAVLRPARDEPVDGSVQGQALRQYDLTPRQYDALVKLSATLCRVFPRIACDYPRDADGKLVTRKLNDAALHNFHGILGHYHIQTDKVDPGPALQWDLLIERARELLRKP